MKHGFAASILGGLLCLGCMAQSAVATPHITDFTLGISRKETLLRATLPCGDRLCGDVLFGDAVWKGTFLFREDKLYGISLGGAPEDAYVEAAFKGFEQSPYVLYRAVSDLGVFSFVDEAAQGKSPEELRSAFAGFLRDMRHSATGFASYFYTERPLYETLCQMRKTGGSPSKFSGVSCCLSIDGSAVTVLIMSWADMQAALERRGSPSAPSAAPPTLQIADSGPESVPASKNADAAPSSGKQGKPGGSALSSVAEGTPAAAKRTDAREEKTNGQTGGAAASEAKRETRKSAEKESRAKPPATYVIRSGDTLDALARRYGISLKTLREANPELNPNRMRVGQRLRLPSQTAETGKKAEAARAAAETGKKAEVARAATVETGKKAEAARAASGAPRDASPEAASSGRKADPAAERERTKEGTPGAGPAFARSHLVRSGDTLGAIALKYGVRLEELTRANPGIRASKLRPGQSLNIPGAGSESGNSDGKKSAAAGEARPVNRNQGAAAEHKSSAGDGNAAGVKPDAAGGETYRVQSGDSLWKLARRFNTSSGELRRLNGLDSDKLRMGSVLRVPAK